MPLLIRPRVTWHGDVPPQEVWSFDYAVDTFAVALWPRGGGSTLGLFPISGDDESLKSPLVGHWKQNDPSLTSLGRYDGGLATLHPPEVPPDYFVDALAIAGFPATAHNVATVTAQLSDMFALKAFEYLSHADGRPAAERFVDQRPWTGDPGRAQQLFDDLGDLHPDVIPFIQQLPSRIKGILLEFGPDSEHRSGLWDLMHR